MLLSDDDLKSKTDPWLSIIRENTERGADLIKQVLTFARGGIQGERIDLHLAHLVKEIIKILRETLPKNISIKYKIDSNLSGISADPTQIHQVLMNLVVNSTDAMVDSGGVLEITVKNVVLGDADAEGRIEASAGNYVVLIVKDSGVGMSEDTLERIWDPFFTTKDIGKGTGLGLSTALSIVKGHGGFIDVCSKENEGTSFSVYIPVSKKAEQKKLSEESLTYPRGNGEFILVVDDEENVLRTTSAALEKYGYKTLTALDGVKALEVFIENEEIDLVVTDMAMPNMDGEATIRALRKIDSTLKIIAVSGFPENHEIIAKDGELPVNAFLSKPFTFQILLNTIADVFKHK